MNPALVVAGTELAKGALELLKDWRKQKQAPVAPGATVEEQLQVISSRLDSLETTETSQTELMKSMAEQVKALSIAQAESARRTNIALALASAGLAAALAAVVLVFVR